jgi:membrane protein insertase Oxa1/YidC/SpoIIIJ
MIYIILIIIIIIIFVYAIFKEREELGCFKFSIAKQCDDNNSVYLINTKMKKKDDKEILIKRLISILSYHEKGGVWKRCYILSFLLIIIVFIVNKLYYSENNEEEKKKEKKNYIYYWLTLLLLFFTIIYFFFNFINYHHFRNLKDNGIEIINTLIK